MSAKKILMLSLILAIVLCMLMSLSSCGYTKSEIDAMLEKLRAEQSDSSIKLDEAKGDFETKIASLEAAITDKAKENADKIAALRAEYEAKVTALNKESGDNKAAIIALKSSYDSKVAELSAADALNAKSLKELKDKYTADLSAITAKNEANTAKINDLTEKYNVKVQELTLAATENAEALEKATKDYSDALKTLDEKYEDEIRKLLNADEATSNAITAIEDAYKSEILALDNKYNGEISALKAKDTRIEAELGAITKKHADDLAALTAEDTEIKASIKALDDKYAAEVDALEAEDARIEAELDALAKKHTSDVAILQNNIDKNNELILANKTALEANIAALTAKHNGEIETINALISSLKATDTASEERIAELEAKVLELLNKPKFTVTFNLNGGEGSIASQVVEENKKAEPPVPPVRDGYVFSGWYVDNEKWSFNGYTITSDITLVASWTELCDYALDEDGNATIVSYNSIQTDIVVPAMINGYPIKRIAENAFSFSANATSLTIPSSVEEIEAGALFGLSSLKEISLPFVGRSVNTATDFGAMFGKSNYPNTKKTTQGSGDYYIPKSLESVEICAGAIAVSAFKNCDQIKNVNLLNGVRSISNEAFKGCTSIESMSLPFIGASRNATAHQATLGFIFGCSITSSSLSDNQSQSSTVFVNRQVGSVEGATWQYSCYDGQTVIPETFTLRSYYYYIPSTLKRVTITDDTDVGVSAFRGCSNITTVILPASISTVGKYAFSGCTNLTIYSEAQTQPDGWASDWNSSRPVIWGWTGDE